MANGYTGYVVLHHGDGGANGWVCNTERAAKNSVYCRMLELLEEIDGDSEQKELLHLIEEDRYDEAVDLWLQNSSEIFEYSRFSLEPSDDKTTKDSLDNLLKSVRKWLTQGEDGVEVWPADDPD